MPLTAEQKRERRALKAAERAKDEAARNVKRRPSGPTPAGKVWDEYAGTWVAEAQGLSSGLQPVPTYLIDRSNTSDVVQPWFHQQPQKAKPKHQYEVMSDEDELEFCFWQSEDELNNYWQNEQLAAMAQRAIEAADWDAKYGEKRDAELVEIMSKQPQYYWALMHRENCESPYFNGPSQDTKWELRKGESLTDDCTRTLGLNQLGVEEPLLLYRSFRPFTGDEFAAGNFFAYPHDREWIREERSKLVAGLDQQQATEQPLLPVESAPQLKDPPCGINVSSGEADHQAMLAPFVVHVPTDGGPRLMCRLCPETEAPIYYHDNIIFGPDLDLTAANPCWPYPETQSTSHRQDADHRPWRSDYALGSKGRQAFREAREQWYSERNKHLNREPLAGTVAEQNTIFDTRTARRFRADQQAQTR